MTLECIRSLIDSSLCPLCLFFSFLKNFFSICRPLCIQHRVKYGRRCLNVSFVITHGATSGQPRGLRVSDLWSGTDGNSTDTLRQNASASFAH